MAGVHACMPMGGGGSWAAVWRYQPHSPLPNTGPRAFAIPSPISTKAFATRCRRVRLMVGPRTKLSGLVAVCFLGVVHTAQTLNMLTRNGRNERALPRPRFGLPCCMPRSCTAGVRQPAVQRGTSNLPYLPASETQVL